MFPRPTIEAFDVYLAERGLRLEAILVGGSALALLGVTDRQTRDVDILHPELSTLIMQAARGFAEQSRQSGVALADDAEPWVAKQDTNPLWPEHVSATLNDLRRRLDHGVQ